MTLDEARRLCERWLPLWTGNRPEELAACYTDDTLYRDPAHPEGLQGREALLRYLRALLARNPDRVWTAEEIHGIEGGFTLKWRARIPVGGEVLEETGLDWVFVRDGKIARNEVYYDRTRLLGAMRRGE